MTARDFRLSRGEDRVTAFVYLLLRDHLPFGKIHTLLQGHLDSADPADALRILRFSDKDAEQQARKIAREILEIE